ncbi:O-acetyl-ADP-ribose deacetylase [Paenibacillus sp. WLX1005]|uniref:O-acetyl-ADP-ribose deacetylase n=1 Tax=Paenibacillus sp. WLX1005 TaxID=3243766 RepID=UPI0039843AFD
MKLVLNGVTIEAVQGDITREAVDAIVNAANSSLLGGGGVDGAIHRAGGAAILEDCYRIRDRQGGCPTGEAVITTAGDLPSQHVIHTVGPVWNGGNQLEPDLLRNCYIHSLQLADEYELNSISFPNISTGIYGYPKPEAAAIAVKVIQQYAETGNGTVTHIRFVCFDHDNLALYEQQLHSLNDESNESK